MPGGPSIAEDTRSADPGFARPSPDDTLEREQEDATEEFLGELRLARRLQTPGQLLRLSLAVLIGVPLLLGGPVESRLAALSPLAVFLAGVFLVFTLLTIFELLGGSSERGGSHGLVAETVGGLPSFLTGWALIGAEMALAGSLLHAGGELVAFSLSIPSLALPVSAGLLSFVLLTKLFSFDRRRRARNVGLILGLLGLAVLLGGALLGPSWTMPPRPVGLDATQVLNASARLMVLYFAVEAVLASRRQIRRERIDLPRALFSALIGGALLLGVPLWLLAGLSGGEGGAAGWRLLLAPGALPGWSVASVGLIAVLLTAHALLTLAARTLYDMTRLGAFPPGLLALRRPFSAPPLLLLVITAGAAGGILLSPLLDTIGVTGGLLLVVILGVNLAGIYSRRTETERRRTIQIPLFPLVPAISIVASLSLLANLGLKVQGAIGVLLLAGGAAYAVYGRRHQVAAQEGVVLFGSDQRVEKEEGQYRILVPVAPGERRAYLLQLAVALAGEQGGDVLPLQVIQVADPLAMEEGRRLARERNTLFRWSTRLASQAGVPIHPVTRLARTVPEGIVDTVIDEEVDLLLLPWAVKDDPESGRMGSVLDPVIEQSPCDTAVVAYRARTEREEEVDPEIALQLEDILVPTAGGPHAPLAIGLALVLARQHGAKVHAVYVSDPSSSEAEIAAGEARIARTLTEMREQVAEALGWQEEADPLAGAVVESRVLLADDVAQGIATASAEMDLAFIGASEESLLDQVLFGNLPRRIAGACQSPVVMVRRYRGLSRFWLRRVWDSISKALPTLTDEDQIELYKRVRRGARPDVDFFVMMGLAAAIAAFGLLLSSGAVIIGAMLVAPLFTPILAFSMAIALGDIRLIRVAVESSLRGIFLAVGLALAIGVLAPLPANPAELPEIASRIQPNLLDLAVALAAGAAGAYAVARRDVAAALPGVAIAAALVPPLAVIGIGLAAGRLAIAGGATLLVTTNLIAISLAGAITLLLLGFRPASRRERRFNLRTGLIVTLVLFFIISVPLAAVLVRAARRSATHQTVTAVLQEEIGNRPAYQLGEVTVEHGDAGLSVTAWAYLRDSSAQIDGQAIAALLEERTGQTVELKLVPIPIERFESPRPTAP